MPSQNSLSNKSLLLIIASAIVILHSTNAITCPSSQTQMGNRCYKTYRPSPQCDRDFSFGEANAFCQANGGVLASIHNSTQADFFTSLIKKDQKTKNKACKNSCPDKPVSCNCANANQDYFYWIGMRLSHSPNGSVSGSRWTDGTPVDYGNPLNASFRPPFVTGRPIGSVGDGQDDSEMCPGGNQNSCVQIYGYGEAMGRWRDEKCNRTHPIQNNCCNATANSNNSSRLVSDHKYKRSSQTSDEDEEDEEVKVDECRDRAALNGYICAYCPDGWTMFQGHCYKAVIGPQTPAQFEASCAALGANVVSIHNAAENVFVADLAAAAGPSAQLNYIGLVITHASNAVYSPITSVAWTDGTPVNYGNPMVAPWSTPGNYPWAPATPPPGFEAQPDNRPPPANCVIQWLPASPAMGDHPGTWDDTSCTRAHPSTVCKLQ